MKSLVKIIKGRTAHSYCISKQFYAQWYYKGRIKGEYSRLLVKIASLLIQVQNSIKQYQISRIGYGDLWIHIYMNIYDV